VVRINLLSLGESKRTNNPRQVRFCCTNCDDQKYHLYVHLGKKLFYCQKCAFKGKVEDLGPTLDNFQDRANKFLTKESREIKERKIMKLPEHFNKLNSNSGLPYNYLINRGINPDEVAQYNMGYCSDGDYSERIILPIYRLSKLIYFVGRSFTNKEPRYFNSISFSKKGVLFTTFAGRVDHAIVVEGVFDAIKIGRVKPAISLLGKRADAAQLQEIAKVANSATIMLDRDAVKEQWELIKQLSFHIPTKYIFLDNYKDPDDIPARELRKIIGGNKKCVSMKD